MIPLDIYGWRDECIPISLTLPDAAVSAVASDVIKWEGVGVRATNKMMPDFVAILEIDEKTDDLLQNITL